MITGRGLPKRCRSRPTSRHGWTATRVKSGRTALVSDYLFRKDLGSGVYRRLTLPNLVYDAVVRRAKTVLFLVLGGIYGLAVLVLEMIIMPRYVYQPLGQMLDADRATQTGDHEHELIPEEQIPGDEIGQIMRSRNQTITELRRHEDELAAALATSKRRTGWRALACSAPAWRTK